MARGIKGTKTPVLRNNSLASQLQEEITLAYNQGWDDALIDLSRILRKRIKARLEENADAQNVATA